VKHAITIVKKLNGELASLQNWCQVNKLEISIDKTKFMFFFHKAHDIRLGNIPKVYIGDKKVERVFSFKCLGVWLDPTMSFNNHLVAVNSKVSSAVGKLYSVKRLISF